MKKNIKILGKKVPILAVLVALLVIGTATAAMFSNYATLTGTDEVAPQVYVTDSEGEQMEIGEEGNLTFNSAATFTISNTGANPATVRLNYTLTTTDELGDPLNNDGLSVTFTGSDVNTTGDLTLVVIPGTDTSTVSVNLDQEPNVVAGNCTIEVDIDAYP